MQLSRITFEVLGPVPAGEIEVHTQVDRPGRNIELLSAAMTAGGRAVPRAAAWRVAASDTAAVVGGEVAPPPPEQATPPHGPFGPGV